MKTSNPINRRAAWLAFVAPAALLSTPAFAQDATPAAPPPVRATLPQAVAPAAAPAVQTPPSSERGRPVESTATSAQSKTVLSPEAQAALDEAKAARAERPAARARTAAPAPRVAARETRTTTTPRAAAPVAAPVPVAAAPAPVTPPAEVAPAPAPAPVAETPVVDEAATTEVTSTQTERTPVWPWIALGLLVVLGAIGLFAWRRKRADQALEEQYAAEPYYEAPVAVVPEPAPVVTPAVAAVAAVPAVERVGPVEEPVAVSSDEATVVEAEEAEVAALTDAAPVKNRPWLEFAMRPVRAGASAEEALVEIELTVANAGTVPAEDVRVSTFMITDAHASEMERMLVDPPADAAVAPVTIAPGEGTRIDATLAALKADLGEENSFTPVVVADARYRLPDGSVGRTSASFVVGVSDDGEGVLRPFDLSDRVMREDIEARLHGEPQHA